MRGYYVLPLDMDDIARLVMSVKYTEHKML